MRHIPRSISFDEDVLDNLEKFQNVSRICNTILRLWFNLPPEMQEKIEKGKYNKKGKSNEKR